MATRQTWYAPEAVAVYWDSNKQRQMQLTAAMQLTELGKDGL